MNPGLKILKTIWKCLRFIDRYFMYLLPFILILVLVFLRAHFYYFDSKGDFLRQKIGKGFFEPTPVFNITFSPDSRSLFVVSESKRIYDWNIEKNELKLLPDLRLREDEYIREIASLPERELAFVKRQNYKRVYEDGSKEYMLEIYDMSKNQIVDSVGLDGKVLAFNFDSKKSELRYTVLTYIQNGMDWKNARETITNYRWNRKEEKAPCVVPQEDHEFHCVSRFYLYGARSLSLENIYQKFECGDYIEGNREGLVTRLSKSDRLASKKIHEFPVNDIAISHNQKYIATVSSPEYPLFSLFHYLIYPIVYPSELKILDATTLETLYEIKRVTSPVLQVRFSPDDKWVAAGIGGYVYLFPTQIVLKDTTITGQKSP